MLASSHRPLRVVTLPVQPLPPSGPPVPPQPAGPRPRARWPKPARKLQSGFMHAPLRSPAPLPSLVATTLASRVLTRLSRLWAAR
jgi:hypothetical protein